MKAQEKFQMICDSLNRTGCGEVQISDRKEWNGTTSTEATFVCGHIFVSVTLKPAGYLHPRTSCVVSAWVRGKKTSLHSAIGHILATIPLAA
jgi:hypothetical protein